MSATTAPVLPFALPSLVAPLRARLATYRTRTALQRLSDRELADIGLCRADIDMALTRSR